jgi:hypothetical protein
MKVNLANGVILLHPQSKEEEKIVVRFIKRHKDKNNIPFTALLSLLIKCPYIYDKEG